jgi:hypothetical protein
MKSKIIAAINAVLKSCGHKPILITAFIVGTWFTTAAKAQVANPDITIDNPVDGFSGGSGDSTATNNTCDGQVEFNGQDFTSGATYEYLEVGGTTIDYAYIDPTSSDAWYFGWEEDHEIYLPNYTLYGEPGQSNWGVYDDVDTGDWDQFTVWWEPDPSCDP